MTAKGLIVLASAFGGNRTCQPRRLRIAIVRCRFLVNQKHPASLPIGAWDRLVGRGFRSLRWVESPVAVSGHELSRVHGTASRPLRNPRRSRPSTECSDLEAERRYAENTAWRRASVGATTPPTSLPVCAVLSAAPHVAQNTRTGARRTNAASSDIRGARSASAPAGGGSGDFGCSRWSVCFARRGSVQVSHLCLPTWRFGLWGSRKMPPTEGPFRSRPISVTVRVPSQSLGAPYFITI